MIQFLLQGMRMLMFLILVRANICQSYVSFSVSFGDLLRSKQKNKDPADWDFEYIEYYHKSLACYTDPDDRKLLLDDIKFHEARRDYFTPSLRDISHLIQIDEQPNLELKESRCEIYKISLSFRRQSKS